MIAGLPEGVQAIVEVSGPRGFVRQVATSATLTELEPGTYTIAVSRVMTALATFVPSFESLEVTVGRQAVSQVTVPYNVATGSIAVTVGGVPPGVPWKVLVTGPASYRDSVAANGTLGNLAPGLYGVSAPEVRSGLSVYQATPQAATLSVTASVVPVAATFDYALVTGTLAVNVNGLPAGSTASVSLSGPGGYTAVVSPPDTLEGLLRGRYDVAAAAVAGASTQYSPAPAQQSVTVVPGAVSVVNVNYWPDTPPAGLNLAIEAVQVQQVVQTYGGGVPLVAGRPGLLRVFVRATGPNAVTPSVRVSLFDGPQFVVATTIAAPAAAVPTSVDEGALGASWNYEIPASLMMPGLRVLAEVDPGNVVAESVESDNMYPSSGAPLALDVRTVAPLALRLVPVTQSVNGLTGDVSNANAPQYAAAVQRLLPVGALTVDVRTPYTTSAPALQANDANGAWLTILSELNALRVADGSTAHYYGVVKVPYSAGVVGISYLPSFVALGIDSLPGAVYTMVHELGHHFGRLHSPSCGATGYDANYPYPGGVIGAFGYDGSNATLRDPSTPDIMGYCNDRWTGDYTYTGILSFRTSQASIVAADVQSDKVPRPGLLVWGRVSDRGLELEPAYEVVAPPSLPTGGGPNRLEIADAAGRILTRLSFRGSRPVDVPDDGGGQYFAFVVPADAFQGFVPARLRLSVGGRSVELAADSRVARARLADTFIPSVERLSSTRVRVRWRDARGRGVLVRDAVTGDILAFGRNGEAVVRTSGQQLKLTLSDGVRSVHRSVNLR